MARVNLTTVLAVFGLVGLAVWLLNFYAFTESAPPAKFVESASDQLLKKTVQLEKRSEITWDKKKREQEKIDAEKKVQWEKNRKDAEELMKDTKKKLSALEAVVGEGYVPCSDEAKPCKCAGRVRYGSVEMSKDGSALSHPRDVPLDSGSIACNNGAFGTDPAPGWAKKCYCLSESAEARKERHAAEAKARGNQPIHLMHKATVPGKDAVMALFTNAGIGGFRNYVGSLRATGYDGHIILGVTMPLPKHEEEYLIRRNVTFFGVMQTQCDATMKKSAGQHIRDVCAEGYEDLKLEWGRYQMWQKWLEWCTECTGWTLVSDARDLYFQARPFDDMPPAATANPNLYLIQETYDETPEAKIDNTHWFTAASVGNCYGHGEKSKYQEWKTKPMLCSGTTVGTREGIKRYLDVIVGEFIDNTKNKGASCIPPSCVDQAVHNYLYYNNRFGEKTSAFTYGDGPIMTVGHACAREVPGKGHLDSLRDIVQTDKDGWVLTAKGKIIPVVHQWDRCMQWMHPLMSQHAQKHNW